MGRKYSIGLFIGTIVAISLSWTSYHIYKIAKNPSTDETKETQTQQIDNGYYLKNVNGYITVFDADKNQIYEETSILFKDLPLPVQKQIEDGYKLETETDVYSFLENYSS